VSLGFVGVVFDVMAQVDRRLTKANTVDLSLGLITPAENLGRHINTVTQLSCVFSKKWFKLSRLSTLSLDSS
jgi:hypothetical protein